jgi:hypothetical protein
MVADGIITLLIAVTALTQLATAAGKKHISYVFLVD